MEHRYPMIEADKVRLWQQRLFETVTGMANYLAERHAGQDLAEWIGLQADIFADLPEPTAVDTAGWQRVFFTAQALLEQFIATRYGEAEMVAWVESNARVHGVVEPDLGRGAVDVVDRIGRQAELYSSDYEIERATVDGARLVISHCAIWDYREKARARGVRLTLASPCTYCTKAISANVRAKGYLPSYELFENTDGHGCRWEIDSAG